MTIRGIIHKLVIGCTLQLVLCATSAFAVEPTLSAIRQTSLNYLSMASGTHNTYSNTVITKDAGHPDIAIVNNAYDFRFFNANEATPELNFALRYLARTGGSAWISSSSSSSNYIFKIGSSYYTYNSNLLPTSLWTATSATGSDYDFAYKNGDSVAYYNIGFVNSDKIS